MRSRSGYFRSARAARRERWLIAGGGLVLLSIFGILGALLMRSDHSLDRAQLAHSPEPSSVYFGHVMLVAPVAEIKRGMRLDDIPLQTVSWPRDKVPEGAIRDPNQIKTMFASADIGPNMPILWSSLSREPVGPMGLSDMLPNGHRAITIEVDASASVEGWASPGAHVDVLLTYRAATEGTNRTVVAVADAVVLSFNRSTGEKKPEVTKVSAFRAQPTHRQVSTVTLAVSLVESLKLRTAAVMGRINLALRNSADSQSSGSAAFSEQQFDTQQVSTRSAPRVVGAARVHSKNGAERNYILRTDKRWWEEERGDLEQ